MKEYIGRFAPTPSGNLHLGSLLCAVVSYLDARSQKGKWLLRIDDVDTPRVVAGAADSILASMEAHALLWDGSVVYQSEQSLQYQNALDELLDNKHAFSCGLTRKILYANYDGIYPGKAFRLDTQDPNTMAIRLDVPDKLLSLKDRWAGLYQHNLLKTSGAFVLKRRDGIYSYHLACTVDDYLSGVTHVVRGRDLLSQTPAQNYLQTLLGYPEPSYAHHGLIHNALSQKLSKQHHAQPIDSKTAASNLYKVLGALNLKPPAMCSCEGILQWAIEHWQEERMIGFDMIDETVL